MSKEIQMLNRLIFVCTIILIGNYIVVAQTTFSGAWKADARAKQNSNKIQLSFERRTAQSKNLHTSVYSYDELQGISRERVATGGAVKFSLVREAGTFECEGSFQNAVGAGTFRFISNPRFVSQMKARGFDFETDAVRRQNQDLADTLFAATTLNITTALADDLLSAYVDELKTEDLFGASIFKINSQFIREMNASGFPNLQMGDLIKARIFKVDAGFVREIAAVGLEKQSFENLVKMKIFKIDAAFVRQAQADGVPLEVDKLVQKKIGIWSRLVQ